MCEATDLSGHTHTTTTITRCTHVCRGLIKQYILFILLIGCLVTVGTFKLKFEEDVTDSSFAWVWLHIMLRRREKLRYSLLMIC